MNPSVEHGVVGHPHKRELTADPDRQQFLLGGVGALFGHLWEEGLKKNRWFEKPRVSWREVEMQGDSQKTSCMNPTHPFTWLSLSFGLNELSILERASLMAQW